MKNIHTLFKSASKTLEQHDISFFFKSSSNCVARKSHMCYAKNANFQQTIGMSTFECESMNTWFSPIDQTLLVKWQRKYPDPPIFSILKKMGRQCALVSLSNDVRSCFIFGIYLNDETRFISLPILVISGVVHKREIKIKISQRMNRAHAN